MRSSVCSMPESYRNSDITSIAFTIEHRAIVSAMETLGDRVRWAREQAGFTQPQLAKKIGMAQARLSKLETGPAPMGTSFIVKIALACKVSAYWLETGRGPRKLGKLEATILELPDAEQSEWLAMIEARKAARGGQR